MADHYKVSISRDHYIDLARGICMVSIIFIHTTFKSGSYYVPHYVRMLSLLLDVPAFFFLSGMTYALTNKDVIVNGLFRMLASFGLLSFFYDCIYSNFNFKNTFKALTLNKPLLTNWPVVSESYWFVPVFVGVSIFGAVVVKKMERFCIPVIVLLFFCFPISFFLDVELPRWLTLGIETKILAYYLALYLLGYIVKVRILGSKYQDQISFLLAIMGVTLFILSFDKKGDEAFDLQTSKLDVTLPYVSASFLSVSAIIFFYNPNLKSMVLEHIGKNSLFYYVGQGVGSSYLYLWVGFINTLWPIKLLLMFVANLILTIIVSETFRIVYGYLGSCHWLNGRLLREK